MMMIIMTIMMMMTMMMMMMIMIMITMIKPEKKCGHNPIRNLSGEDKGKEGKSSRIKYQRQTNRPQKGSKMFRDKIPKGEKPTSKRQIFDKSQEYDKYLATPFLRKAFCFIL